MFTARSGGAITITQSGLTSRPDHIGGAAVNRNWRHDEIYLNKATFVRVPLSREELQPLRAAQRVQLHSLLGVTSSINSATFGLLTSNAGARQIQLNGWLTF